MFEIVGIDASKCSKVFQFEATENADKTRFVFSTRAQRNRVFCFILEQYFIIGNEAGI